MQQFNENRRDGSQFKRSNRFTSVYLSGFQFENGKNQLGFKSVTSRCDSYALHNTCA